MIKITQLIVSTKTANNQRFMLLAGLIYQKFNQNSRFFKKIDHTFQKLNMFFKLDLIGSSGLHDQYWIFLNRKCIKLCEEHDILITSALIWQICEILLLGKNQFFSFLIFNGSIKEILSRKVIINDRHWYLFN